MSPSRICDTLEAIELPLSLTDVYKVRYALLELIANAVRASEERRSDEPVRLYIWCEGGRVMFRVSDSAGGFDPKILPYDIFSDCEEIDPTSPAFERYRAEHGEGRFGLGLFLAKRAVEDFDLRFVDAEGNSIPWRSDGSVRGTVITFSMPMREPGDDHEA